MLLNDPTFEISSSTRYLKTEGIGSQPCFDPVRFIPGTVYTKQHQPIYNLDARANLPVKQRLSPLFAEIS